MKAMNRAETGAQESPPIRRVEHRLLLGTGSALGWCFALLALLILPGALPGVARALDFQVDFVSSTYQVQAGDTFSDLLLEHQSGVAIQSNVTNSLENISTAVHAAGVNRDYSQLMSTTIEVGIAGTYTFQVGTDWGRGGAAALIDDSNGQIVSERVITDDVWWAYNWNNPDVFTTTFDFAVGDSYTLMWVGFEGCCGGSTTLRFSVDGAAYQPLTESNLQPFVVPEPGPLLLLGLGLAGLSFGAQRTGHRTPSDRAPTSPL